MALFAASDHFLACVGSVNVVLPDLSCFPPSTENVGWGSLSLVLGLGETTGDFEIVESESELDDDLPS